MRATDPEVRDRERTGGSGTAIAIGIVMVILGLIAIARPLYATIASTLVFGWLFIFAGIAQIAHAVGSRGAGQFVWKLLLGVLYLGAGIVVISNVFSGAIALTLILGITIFVQGALQVILAFGIRPARNAWPITCSDGLSCRGFPWPAARSSRQSCASQFRAAPRSRSPSRSRCRPASPACDSRRSRPSRHWRWREWARSPSASCR